MDSRLVKNGYDLIAEEYLQNRSKLKTNKYLSKLLKLLPRSASVLDLGCGAGVPVDDVLLKAGHRVIGVDNSRSQIELARKYCPSGEYIVADIGEMRDGEYQAQAVVCLYALFHLPRGRHEELIKIMASFLRPGGYLLITMGDREFEGEHLMHGVTMWSSQYGVAKNIEMVRRAGFEIITNELDTSGGERHLVILAQKLT